jgi:hypothetical protein
MKRNLLILVFVFSIGSVKSQSWTSAGNSSLNVEVLKLYNGELYAGGVFLLQNTTHHIVKWNGITWDSLYSDINTYPYALAEYNGELYAGGSFTIAGGDSISYIAKWNGSFWDSLGSGVNGTVKSLAVYNGELYVGGLFTVAGGINTKCIAKWNGMTWDSVGSGVAGFPNAVISLKEYNGELYAAGTFDSAGGIQARRIAKWDGTAWDSVGSGVNGVGVTLAVYNGKLYLGGSFHNLGNLHANNIAKWDGTVWDSVGSGVDSTFNTVQIQTLLEYNGYLYAGGTFYIAGGNTVHNIAKCDGTNWYDVDNGMGSGGAIWVRALDIYNGELYAGGHFYSAGSIVANSIAKLYAPLGIEANLKSDSLSVYPNPSKGLFTLESYEIIDKVKLYDLQGKLLLDQIPHKNKLQVDLSDLSSGLYFLNVNPHGKNVFKKIIKL